MNRQVQENRNGRCNCDSQGPDKPVRKSVKLSGRDGGELNDKMRGSGIVKETRHEQRSCIWQ